VFQGFSFRTPFTVTLPMGASSSTGYCTWTTTSPVATSQTSAPPPDVVATYFPSALYARPEGYENSRFTENWGCPEPTSSKLNVPPVSAARRFPFGPKTRPMPPCQTVWLPC